jgi:hypothetical protein
MVDSSTPTSEHHLPCPICHPKLLHLLLQVGTGQAAYKAAVDAIKQWAHLQLGWNMTTTPSMKVGTTICSATQTVVPWSVLPARVTYMNEGAASFDGGKGETGLAKVGPTAIGLQLLLLPLAPRCILGATPPTSTPSPSDQHRSDRQIIRQYTG